MVNDSLINFEKGDYIYLMINGQVNTDKLYEILDIDCETTGGMAFGHHNMYYALLKDMSGDNVFRTLILNIDLLSERSEIYAIKLFQLETKL
jgi:hypothetical protein